MEFTKLTKKDLERVRLELLQKQMYRCPITGRDMKAMHSSNLCVDHDHFTGIIRGVLPKGINGLEGKVKAILKQYGHYQETDRRGMAQCLRGLADYLTLHIVPQTPYLHPSHLSPAEQRLKRNALARKRYAALNK